MKNKLQIKVSLKLTEIDYADMENVDQLTLSRQSLLLPRIARVLTDQSIDTVRRLSRAGGRALRNPVRGLTYAQGPHARCKHFSSF